MSIRTLLILGLFLPLLAALLLVVPTACSQGVGGPTAGPTEANVATPTHAAEPQPTKVMTPEPTAVKPEPTPAMAPEPTYVPNPVATATPVANMAATPDLDAAKYGGALRVAYAQDYSPPDPIDAEAGIVLNMLEQVFEPLIRLNPDATYVPSLATSWYISDDATQYTFNLREEVTFHNGAEFTAEDVVFSLGRARDPDISILASKLEAVEDVVAVDDYTVRIDLSAPNVLLLDALFPIQAGILDSEADVEKLRSAEEVYGTGPFMLDELVPRERIAMVRNPNHWSGSLPYLDELVFLGIQEQEGRREALLRGEVDVVHDIELESVQVDAINANPGTHVLNVDSSAWIGIAINNLIPPFDNKLVRQALRYAVDRDLVNQMAFLGLGAPMNDSPVWPGDSRFYAPEYLPEYDPEMAKALLAEAGYRDGIDIDIETVDLGPGMLELPVAFKESAAAAGIRVKIRELPLNWPGWQLRDYGPLTAFWVSARPHPNHLLRSLYHSTERWALTYFDKQLKEGYEFAPYGIADWTTFESVFTDKPGPLAQQLDALIERARRETLDQQMVTYREIQAFLAEHVPQLVIASIPRIAGARADVQGLALSPISHSDYYDKVWLER